MIDLSKNPYQKKNGEPLTGQEKKWLDWRSDRRRKANPYEDDEGNISDFEKFCRYRNQTQKDFQEDLKLLPINLQQEITQRHRLLEERMQVEQTGRRL